MNDFYQELQGYKLTTAQIFYHMPDHPNLLQEFIWQHYDISPQFPKLKKFLGFWKAEIEGDLHSVYIAKKELITPSKLNLIDTELMLQ